MPLEFTDVRSSPQDQIAHAARVLGRSADRKKVFSAIFRGKKRAKTASEISQMTKLGRIRVLQEAGVLCNNNIIRKTVLEGEIGYEKDAFYNQNKKLILRLARNKRKLEQFPTSSNPKIRHKTDVVLRLPRKAVSTQQLTIDDIDSFRAVRDIDRNGHVGPIDEREFKRGIQHLLDEEGNFSDWGGEINDLFTTRLRIDGTRKAAAFGFKGKGTQGKLTPRKMGKQGDQIQRLFRSPAEIYLVQYWGQVDESVLEQMKSFASAKSASEGKTIYFGTIDGTDTRRLIQAYPEYFAGL